MNRRSVLAALGCAAALTWMAPTWSADKFEVIEARLEALQQDGSVLLSADFNLSLTATLRDAVSRGLPLYFLTELEVQRQRWYWLDAVVIETRIEWRLSYHALTRQFRVASAHGSDAFASLDEALVAMSSVRRWPVGRIDQFDARNTYQAWVRMRLDTTRLPKPFQMTALTDRDWNPQSEWTRFAFTVPTRTSAR